MEQNSINNNEKIIEVPDNTQPVLPDNNQSVVPDNAAPIVPDNTMNEILPIISNINPIENNNLTDPISLENNQNNFQTELEKHQNEAQLISNNNYNTESDINQNKMDINTKLNSCYSQNKYEDALKSLMKCEETKFNPSTYEFNDESLNNMKSSLILIDEIKERIEKVKEKKESFDEIELKKRISKLEEENERLKQELNNENGFQLVSNNQISLFNDHFFS